MPDALRRPPGTPMIPAPWGSWALAMLLAGSAAFVGDLLLGAPPWGLMVGASGCIYATRLSRGPLAGLVATGGILLAGLARGYEPFLAATAASSIALALLALAVALRALGVDRRLATLRDLAISTLGATLAAGLVVACVHTAMGGWRAAMAQPLDQLLAPVAVLVVGTWIGVLPWLRDAWTDSDENWRRLWPRLVGPALAVLAPAPLAWWCAATGWSAAAAMLLFVPQLPMLLLVQRGGLRPAAWVLLVLAAIIGAAGKRLETLPLAPWVGAAAMASTLVTMLMAHVWLAQVRRRELRWECALDGSRLGVADWGVRSSRGFASSTWQTLTGLPGPRWNPDNWIDAIHPDDQDRLRHALAEVGAGRSGRELFEVRARAGPSQWRWLEITLLVSERRPDGLPARLLATATDVGERHSAEERQRLSSSLFQHLHEGLLITDAELRVLDANPAYTTILGVPRDELLGTVPSLLRPTPADPIARQQRAAMWDGLRHEGTWRGELLERRRNGEPCMLQATISSVLGPEGDLRYHVLVISDITEQQAQREQLERQAHLDELTRLPNRARLAQLLDDAIRAADRDGYLLVVCYLDLDRFKPVNDRFGHEAGDRLLVELAGRLRGALRSRDHWADTAARLGGDEFVLLMRAGTIEEARMAVERVLRVVAQPYLIDPAEEPVTVTASMGATIYPIDRSDADALLRHADHAMYGAKQSGRNGYLFFDPEHRRRTEERVMAIGRVQEALDRDEFILYYQPKVEMRTGRVLGLEALLRWEHPQQGLVSPMQFLHLIEHTGLSSRIGDWVFAQALEHLSQWRRQGLDVQVSVNVSARHLQEPDFVQRLAELLARHPEPLATHFELEILESVGLEDVEATSALLARCRALGVHIALDDFGTRFSPLTYLSRLPFDVLKIDRSFVRQMLDNAQDRGIVEGVIGLAHTLGRAVVAEGVESPAQARLLMELGCDIGQGTAIAAAMPVGQVASWVRDWRGVFKLATAAAPAAGSATPRSAAAPE